MKKNNVQIAGLFFFVIICWSMSWPINKLGLSFISPLWYTTLRLLIGTITMFIMVVCTKKYARPTRHDMPLIFVGGVFQISLYLLFANIGLYYLPAGRASLLAYTTPLWVMPCSIFLFDEKSTPLKWLGFFLSMLGLLWLLSPKALDWSNRGVLIGTGMLLLASLIWGVSIVMIRYMRWHKSALQLIPWQLAAGTLPILLYACYQEPHFHLVLDHRLIFSLLFMGVIVTGFSYWAGLVINKTMPTIMTSIGFLMVPVINLMMSAWLFNETISLSESIAMTAILLGLICIVIEF